MKSFKYVLFFIVLIVLTAGCTQSNNNTAGSSDTASEFLIAVIPSQNQGNMQVAMTQLAELLTDKLERPVSIKVYPDYNGVVEAMNYGQVDMAYFGPLTYIIAHHESGAKAILTQNVDGKPFYYSYIITHKDQPWSSLDELLEDPKQVSFAFGDPNSTSGSLIPGIELKDRGVYTDPQVHKFMDVRFTGSHDVTALAVENKTVDAGAIDSAIYDILVTQERIDPEQIKVIWQSQELFQYPWAVEKNTDQTTIERLQKAFLAIKDPVILDAFGASDFTIAADEDYEAIRGAAEKDGRLE